MVIRAGRKKSTQGIPQHLSETGIRSRPSGNETRRAATRGPASPPETVAPDAEPKECVWKPAASPTTRSWSRTQDSGIETWCSARGERYTA